MYQRYKIKAKSNIHKENLNENIWNQEGILHKFIEQHVCETPLQNY